MKRLNPKTGQPFKHGDVRSDGKRFYNYINSQINKDGYFQENWITEEKFKEYKNNTLYLTRYIF